MKYLAIICFGILGITLMSAIGASEADEPLCYAEYFKADCGKKIGSSYTFSKSKVIDIESRKDLKNAIYTITFSKGLEYLITTCDYGEADNRMVVELLDRHDQKILSNYLPSQKKVFDKLAFKCRSSGVYSLRFYFTGNSGKGCGLSMIGFKPFEK